MAGRDAAGAAPRQGRGGRTLLGDRVALAAARGGGEAGGAGHRAPPRRRAEPAAGPRLEPLRRGDRRRVPKRSAWISARMTRRRSSVCARTAPRVPVAGMSEGARDQLFLSLRLALLELRAVEPLPFIADDLLSSFDEARTARMLGLLGRIRAGAPGDRFHPPPTCRAHRQRIAGRECRCNRAVGRGDSRSCAEARPRSKVFCRARTVRSASCRTTFS